MRKLLLIGFIILGNLAISQEQLTNELIWYSREFSTGYVSGLNSMNDGLHYTQMDYDRETESLSINKHSYATGEKVATLFNSADLSEK